MILLLFVIVFSGAVYVYITTDTGKQFLSNKVQTFLAKKLKVNLTIGSVDYHFPDQIQLSRLYLPTPANETFLRAGRITVSVSLFKLMTGETEIKNLELNNTFLHLTRSEGDSNFNFQFILDAFASNTKAKKVSTDTADLKLNLRRLHLNKVVVYFSDEYKGQVIYGRADSLLLHMRTFKPERLKFDISGLSGKGLTFHSVITKHNDNNMSTSQPPLSLLLNAVDVDLSHVHVTMSDHISGFYYANTIKHLTLNKAALSLRNNQVTIDQVNLDSSLVEITTKPLSDPVSGGGIIDVMPWSVQVAQMNLVNNSFKLSNGKPHKRGFDVNHINATALSLVAHDLFYSFDSTHISIKNLHAKDHSGLCIDTVHANIRYSKHQLSATDLYVKTPHSLLKDRLQLYYDDLAALSTDHGNPGLDINIVHSMIALDDLFIVMPEWRTIPLLAAMQHEAVTIHIRIFGSLKQLHVPLLQVVSENGTSIDANAILTNVTDRKNMGFEINVLPSGIVKTDLSKLIVFNKKAYAQLPSKLILQGKINGTTSDLIANVALNGNQLLLNATARLLHVMNPSQLHYDIDIRRFNIQKDLMMAVLPKMTLPGNIELPDRMQLVGTAIGDRHDIRTNLYLDGDFGKIAARGFLQKFDQSDAAVYTISVTTDQFLIGRFLKQDAMLDAVTMHGIIKGRGFDFPKLVGSIEAEISQIGFNHYDYQHLNFTADLSHGAFQSTGYINDPNLRLKYTANSNSVTDPLNLSLVLHIDTARLHALHVIQDTIDLSANITLKAGNLNMSNQNAILVIDSAIIFKNNKRITIDTVVVMTSKENELQILTIQSPMMALNAKGDFDYDQLKPAMMNFLNKYYRLTDIKPQRATPQQIAFEGTIYEHPLITNFVTHLTHYDSIVVKGNFNSMKEDSALNFSLEAPYIKYGDYKINNTTIRINNAGKEFKILVAADSIESAETNYFNTQLSAILSHDSIHVDAFTKNKDGKDRYALGAFISVNNKAYTVHLNDRLILNNRSWAVQPDNTLFYSPSGYYVSGVNLTNEQSYLRLQSKQELVKSPIDIEIRNFPIRDIASLFNKDTAFATGLINGHFNVTQLDKTLPSFEGELNIDSLFVHQHKVGNLALTTQKIDENTIHAGVILSDNENDLSMDGDYYLNNTDKQFDADVIIRKLNVLTLEGFSNGNITNATGSLNGMIHVKGTLAAPVWNGKIHFTDPSFRLAKLGTAYKLDNQTITLDYPDIALDQFTITDTANHKLTFNGTITATSISDYLLNLDIKSNDFIIVDAPHSTNEYIYGFAGINADLSVWGPMTSPAMRGSLSLNDATDATIILPQQSENKDRAQSVIRFIDRDTFNLPKNEQFNVQDSTKRNIQTALNYNVNIDVSKKASLTVIIDPSTGDQLKLSGDAKLNVGVDAGGNILLVGNYDLAKGYYILHYQFLHRQFDLLPQSTILFSGNPIDAKLDIRAEYTAVSSAIDLVGNELGDADSKIVNSFNQKIPFKVLLFIKGTLKKLDISFDIKLPDENAGLSNMIVTTVENKLTQLRADPSAINKQVFSLLVFNRFIGEQSSDFFKGNDAGAEEMARESVSKFLSAALDQIASDLVKGVDIDLNVNTYKDYSNGEQQQRTDLNVGVTKRFMDDRLSISLGKDFGVEGYDKSGKTRGSTNASYLPNAIVNYKLSKDGKYAVRVYSKNKFEVILDGYVVESGLSFILTMDYEKIRELFGKNTLVN